MDLYYRKHKTNLEIYVAASTDKPTHDYAYAMLKHFHPSCLGVTSYKALEEFKMFVFLHGHTIVLEE